LFIGRDALRGLSPGPRGCHVSRQEHAEMRIAATTYTFPLTYKSKRCLASLIHRETLARVCLLAHPQRERAGI